LRFLNRKASPTQAKSLTWLGVHDLYLMSLEGKKQNVFIFFFLLGILFIKRVPNLPKFYTTK
jgi:hypothetical protein